MNSQPDWVFLPKEIICTHTHGRDMEFAEKTTLEQTLIEADVGRISKVCYEPNAPAINSIDRLQAYELVARQAAQKTKLNIGQYFWFGLTDDNIADCIYALRKPWVVGLKEYPGSEGGSVTTGTVAVFKRETTISGMRLVKNFDKAFQVHCEDPRVIKNEGHTKRAETVYLRRILDCAAEVKGVRVIIAHVTCRESIEMIKAARARGINVVPEITPHHLWFSSDGDNWNKDIDPVFYHCYNPIREQKERDYLRLHLKYDLHVPTIMGCDHAAHRTEDKLKGAAGIPSIMHAVPVAVTLAKKLNISEFRLADFLSFNASNILKIPAQRKLVSHRIKMKIDDRVYNNGIVTSPWHGEFYFPREETA